MKPYRNLFNPGRIGNLELKNRIVMPPMVTHLSKNGGVTSQLIRYYVERARGGAGLIVVESAYTSPKRKRGRLSIYDDGLLPGLKSLTNAIHDADSKVAIEINISRGRLDDIDPVSPSDVPLTKVRPRVLPIEEIEQMVQEFGKAVRRARGAGFDAVMIHGAHGYLVSEFLSARTNLRNDKYGGDLTGRAKFALELVRIAKEKTENDYPVIFRLSASERLPGGFELEEAIEVCKFLQDAGVDALDIVSGAAETMEWVVPYMSFPQGYNVQLSKEITKVVKIPTLVAGRINDPKLADEIIKQRKADFVDLGRALIADPDLPTKAAEGRINDIRPCIGCLQCIESFLKSQPLACAVNPAVGKEETLILKHTKSSKKVFIVGGGPAGMQAAIVTRSRGHQVTLWEKERKLGGQLHLAGAPSQKQDIRNLLRIWLSVRSSGRICDGMRNMQKCHALVMQ